jgi:hypothetical protein
MAADSQYRFRTIEVERLTLCFGIPELVGQRLALALGQGLYESQCLTKVSGQIMSCGGVDSRSHCR